MKPVLQSSLPTDLWGDDTAAQLPGIQPLAEPKRWLLVDDAFGGQMQLRDNLIANKRADVVALDYSALPAAQELLEHVLATIDDMSGYSVSGTAATRPDGVEVALDRDDPLGTAGRLVQEDLCLMQARGDVHLLTGAVLCFPAGWTLSEKIMRPLVAIHTPVPSYDANIAQRVQRLFDGIKTGSPLWRANGFFYDSPALFVPFAEAEPRPGTSANAPFVRVERQCLLRLPDTNAVVFSIHTFVVKNEDLTPKQINELHKANAPNYSASTDD